VPTPAATTRPTPRPSPTSTAGIAPPPISFKPGQIAIVTATEGLRMRTMPSVDGGSDRYAPLLPEDTDLYVISGPTHGSGYDWYEVSPITFRIRGIVEWPNTIVGPGSTGYVAAASREGEPWLAHGTASCPAAPPDVLTLAGLTTGARLGCFGGVPISIRARLVPCNCDVDGPEFRPAWLNGVLEGGDGQELVIVPPTTRAPLDSWPHRLDMLWLVVDPEGSHPDPIPVDTTVTVTGEFDHPAAAACRARGMDNPAFVPTDACRSWFVVTSIR
jgi:hypothetical protein